MTITARQRRDGVIALLLAGLALRLWLVSRTTGDQFDLESVQLFYSAVVHHGLHAYSTADRGAARWPYPPGWFPVIAVCVKIGRVLHLAPGTAQRLPLIAADIVLAWLVQAILGWSGRAELERLLGAGLIALGPPIIAVSVLQGQLDDVSALIVLAAIGVWLRMESERRWLVAGLLLGLGAAIKITPIFAVLALLPTARSAGERIRLTLVALAVPALALLPFVAVAHGTVHDITGYHGGVGLGGPNLLIQPHLADFWFTGAPASIGRIDRALEHLATPIALVGVAIAGSFAWRRRLDPLTSGVLIYATLLTCSVNIYLQYAVWLLPLLVASGRLRAAAAASAVLCVPIVFRYAGELQWHTGAWRMDLVQGIYVPIADLLWLAVLGFTLGLAWQLRRTRWRS